MAKRKKDVHFLLFPVAVVICGKVHEHTYKATFESYSEVDEEEGLMNYIQVNELTYTDEMKRVFNAFDIIESGDMNDMANTIMECIFSNQNAWDNPERWW